MTPVSCPHCGHASRDAEFCDACNREIGGSSGAPDRGPAQIDLGNGQIIPCPFLEAGWPALERSEPFEVSWSKPRRGRLHAISPHFWPELQEQVEERQRTVTPALPPVAVVPAEGGAVVVAEYLDHLENPGNWPAFNTTTDWNTTLDSIQHGCRRYGRLMSELHQLGFVWLNFDPAAIELSGSQARITNLDTVLFRIGECPSRLRVSPQYSPPEVCRFQGTRIGPSSDVFHLAMWTYYALANLLPGGCAGSGLEASDFQIPQLRIYQPTLPAGIWPVIARGLCIDPAGRHATIAEFLADFELAVAQIALDSIPSVRHLEASAQRADCPRFRKSARRLRLIIQRRNTQAKAIHHSTDHLAEIGFLTITGAAKTALGGLNQDTVAVESIQSSGRTVPILIVADGVSTCRVGRGELASQTAVQTILDVVRREVVAGALLPDWPTLLEQSCLEASAAILHAAQGELTGQSPVADNDIMSTTVVIGAWDGSMLHLANAGDSRAYLIRRGIAEQLTVDGDVGTSQLASGTPPEQVLELGVAAKSLRYCLGACLQDAEQRLIAHPERCRPAYSRWRLLPGDTVVLCSDGLVEEGVFLEPAELATIVTAEETTPAQRLAEQLVTAADRRQRPPDAREPAGFGDNIACVVLRIVGSLGTEPRIAADMKVRADSAAETC